MSVQDSSNQQLVGLLYRDHRDWLFGWLRKSLNCAQRAEDLSQDTFVRLLGRADLHSPREPRALLTTIAKGLLVDQFRRNALERAYLEALAQAPEAVQPSPARKNKPWHWSNWPRLTACSASCRARHARRFSITAWMA